MYFETGRKSYGRVTPGFFVSSFCFKRHFVVTLVDLISVVLQNTKQGYANTSHELFVFFTSALYI